MMKRILIAFTLTLLMASGVALAQSSEDRAGFAVRGTQNKDVSSAAVKQVGSTLVSEIYPNPVADQGSISINLGAPGKIVFYNLLGTPVFSQEFGKEAKVISIDFASIAEGVYFGIVSSGNKTVATRRISVKR